VADGIDFEGEGLLEGLDGSARRERLDLLRWLEEEGFDAERLRQAHDDGLLLFLAADREVSGEARHTPREVAAEAATDPELLRRIRRAQGLPVHGDDERSLTDEDLENARTARAFLDLGIEPDTILATSRVLGRAMAPTAESFRATLLETVLEEGVSERDLAQRYAAAVRHVMPLARQLIQGVLGMHLRNMVQMDVADHAALVAGRMPSTRRVTIAFADLVGFTRLGEEVPAEQLGDVAEELARAAGEVVGAPVRLVKTIGDAVMLASPDPQALVATGLDLVEALQREDADLPQVRVGIAHGEALTRGGDWFGQPVNLASRVTAVARAGSVLATRDVRDAAPHAFRWSSAHARRLKGLPEPVPLYRARRLAAAS
jgi:adenylate cyclase